MKLFNVEKYNASDDNYKITDIYYKCGQYVKDGDIIFTIETSKASFDIVAEISGYLFFESSLNSTLVVGDLFYIIADEQNIEYKNYYIKNIPNIIDGITITEKANYLILKYNLDVYDFKLNIIREIDVLNYLNKNNDEKIYLSPSLYKYLINDKSVLIFGAGHGNISACNTFNITEEFKPFGFVNYNLEIGTEYINNLPVFGYKQLQEIYDCGCKNIFINVPFTILDNHLEEIKKIGYVLVNCIHKSSTIALNAKIGSSVFISANAVVDELATVDDFALIGNNATLGCKAFLGFSSYILNNASVAHDSYIGKASIISDGARIAGRVEIGENTLVGLNATVNMDLKIGNNCIVYSGANLFNHLQHNKIFKNK
jgi:carbonic anhydrase/acetyltransferase-like protein (isoleucine patch superfamily)